MTQYTPAFYVFMTIDDARELFGAGSDEYNVVFSDKDLEVDPARLYATTTKADIESAAGISADQMRSMVIMIVIISTLIFVVVMYLMMKVMIDRSAFSISIDKGVWLQNEGDQKAISGWQFLHNRNRKPYACHLQSL